MTLTATQLDALPPGSAVRCTADRGMAFLALKIDQGTGRHNPSRWNTTDGPATTVQIAAHNPVRLVPAADTTVDEPSDEALGRLLDAVNAHRAALHVHDGPVYANGTCRACDWCTECGALSEWVAGEARMTCGHAWGGETR